MEERHGGGMRWLDEAGEGKGSDCGVSVFLRSGLVSWRMVACALGLFGPRGLSCDLRVCGRMPVQTAAYDGIDGTVRQDQSA